MPEPASPAATPAAPIAPATPSTPTSGAPAEPSAKTYSESEFRALESKFTEADRLNKNAELFFNSDKEVKDRLGLYIKSYQESTPYEKLIADYVAGKTTPAATATPAPAASPALPGMTPDQIRQMVADQTRAGFEGLTGELSNIQAEASMNRLLEANEWASPETMTEFDKRLNTKVTERAKQIYQASYPRLDQRGAEQMAWNELAKAFPQPDGDNTLFQILMQDKRDEWIASGRRSAPTLPAGMGDALPTGKDPELLTKARKALAAVEGNGEKVAEVIKEYAPQFGVDPQDGSAVMGLYKQLNKVR